MGCRVRWSRAGSNFLGISQTQRASVGVAGRKGKDPCMNGSTPPTPHPLRTGTHHVPSLPGGGAAMGGNRQDAGRRFAASDAMGQERVSASPPAQVHAGVCCAACFEQAGAKIEYQNRPAPSAQGVLRRRWGPAAPPSPSTRMAARLHPPSRSLRRSPPSTQRQRRGKTPAIPPPRHRARPPTL